MFFRCSNFLLKFISIFNNFYIYLRFRRVETTFIFIFIFFRFYIERHIK